MKVVIRCDDGLYSFIRLGFLGSNCVVDPEDIYDIDLLAVETWEAISELQNRHQAQLRSIVNKKKA
jgi:hypothetical protein